MDTALAPTPVPLVRPALRPDPDVATSRPVTARVTDGLDGALRVLSMLRSRRYRVRDLGLDVREDGEASRVTCTVVLTRADLDLLLVRLRRVPAVVSAQG